MSLLLLLVLLLHCCWCLRRLDYVYYNPYISSFIPGPQKTIKQKLAQRSGEKGKTKKLLEALKVGWPNLNLSNSNLCSFHCTLLLLIHLSIQIFILCIYFFIYSFIYHFTYCWLLLWPHFLSLSPCLVLAKQANELSCKWVNYVSIAEPLHMHSSFWNALHLDVCTVYSNTLLRSNYSSSELFSKILQHSHLLIFTVTFHCLIFHHGSFNFLILLETVIPLENIQYILLTETWQDY